jgi:ribosome assembly protein 4
VVNTGRTEHVLSGHKGPVWCVRWGGTGQIYTASSDKMVKVWDAVQGTLIHTLASHAHRVNHLALSTDFVLRTGYFDHTKNIPASEADKRAKARERFEKTANKGGKPAERILSASDDLSIFLWDPAGSGSKPVAQLRGHQNKVNHVTFSPDGSLIASSGWDNSVKKWSGRDGSFICSMRGHVGEAYQCVFSADSRLLVSGSKDTTLKVWDMRSGKLFRDLPGHSDAVWAVDWSPDGQRVASGGNDRMVRIWRH